MSRTSPSLVELLQEDVVVVFVVVNANVVADVDVEEVVMESVAWLKTPRTVPNKEKNCQCFGNCQAKVQVQSNISQVPCQSSQVKSKLK